MDHLRGAYGFPVPRDNGVGSSPAYVTTVLAPPPPRGGSRCCLGKSKEACKVSCCNADVHYITHYCILPSHCTGREGKVKYEQDSTAGSPTDVPGRRSGWPGERGADD